jgi:DNA-binding NarL/FixJ family response regulator
VTIRLKINTVTEQKEAYMYYIFGSLKQISALKVIARPPIGTLRPQVPIVVIDDNGFLYLDVLRNHGFRITELRDVNDVRTVEPYPIVVSDIRGVGGAFKSQYEGAHVLAEIRKHYPNKILLVYTGQQFDATFNRYFALCDGSITKDAESQQWVEVLDNAIATFLDPIGQWKKLRSYLIALDVPTIRLAELEHQYVSAVLKKQAPFQDQGKLIDLPQDVKNVLLGVASSYVFKWLAGQ